MTDLPVYTGPMEERRFHLANSSVGPIVDATDVGAVYLAVPGSVDLDRMPARIVLGLHGSGRSAESYAEIPFYRYQRDRALRSQYIFASVSNGPAGWGLDEGLQSVLILMGLLCGEFGSDCTFVPWGSSAGGIMMFRVIHELADSDRFRPIDRGIGTFPVYDLFSVFGKSPGCGKAWRAESMDELKQNAGDRNPPLFAENVAGCRYWIGHGIDDILVDLTENAERLQRDIVPYGGEVVLHRAGGGHSTQNFLVYDDEALGRFLDG